MSVRLCLLLACCVGLAAADWPADLRQPAGWTATSINGVSSWRDAAGNQISVAPHDDADQRPFATVMQAAIADICAGLPGATAGAVQSIGPARAVVITWKDGPSTRQRGLVFVPAGDRLGQVLTIGTVGATTIASVLTELAQR